MALATTSPAGPGFKLEDTDEEEEELEDEEDARRSLRVCCM